MQLDAKAQSFQIIGGLLGDRFLLQLVFVLEGSESLDIYAYYLGKLKEEITNGSLAISIKEALDVYEKSIVVSDYYRAPLHKALKILNYIDKQILTRDFVKRILMFTSYNKSLKETVEDELKRFFKPKYSNYKGLFPVMHLLVSKVLLFLKQDFPKIGKLKRLFTHLASIGVILNKGIFMSLNNSSALGEEPLLKRSFLQNYPKMTTFKVQR